MADVIVGGSGEVEYLVPGVDLEAPAGQSVGNGDVAVITPQAAVGAPTHTPGRPFKGRYLLLKIEESGSTTTAVYTVEAGVQGGTPANLAAYGDSDTSTVFADGEVRYLQLELARYLQADGTVRVAVAGGAGSALTFTALVLDKAS